jgi:phosphoserine aminotransferase
MSVMEFSHRSKHFASVLKGAENGIRELLNVPDDYSILFLQGGASLQFSMIPMNLLEEGRSADYVVTGAWGKKAVPEARKAGGVNVIYSSEADGFRTVPGEGELRFDANASYLHYTSNETIEGVQFPYEMKSESGVPVVCDMSSDILSREIDVANYGVIYAGAQKNIGPSGVTLVIIRNDLLERSRDKLPSMLNFRLFAENHSMLNTPNTWGIYLVDLVCGWLREQGGLSGISKRNREKATILYDAIDSSDGYFSGHAERNARSSMNVTFRLPSDELDEKFCREAADRGLDGLRGHRSVGGIRASIYNAFPLEGVHALCEFMQDFSARNG